MIALLIHLLVLFAILGIAALALNLTLGWAGLINLGFMGLVSIGAYSTAILTTLHGWPMYLGVILGMIFAAIASLLLGLLIRTMSGDTLAAVLLGFNFTVYSVGLNWTSLTRGPLGIPGILRPELIREDRFFLILALVLFGLTLLIVQRITKSPFGRALGAIRDDELHARVLGKRAFRVKLITHVISGALAGLSGALLAHFIRFIDPASFFIPQLILVISMVFVGGLASTRGTVIGALIMTFVPEIVDIATNLPSATVGALRAIIFALILLMVVLFRPKGIFGTVELPSYADRD
ncbi:branched-chain amino acid ABC transporter permease [Candidatus Uhrbacteria bacterium]|nr:branched-chain amino acid ABC transporter permease [Candidatus Uhrbacteria bacterium]